jgi:(+)-beta-caryophyllene/(+)-caryolan-1-ol synthase
MKMPVFHMPFPEVRTNPALAAAEAGMWRWIDEIGLSPSPAARRHMIRTRPALTMALYHPAADESTLELAAQYTAWAFTVDDEFDDGAAGLDPGFCARSIETLIDVLHGRQPKGVLAVALDDLWRRLAHGRSRAWRTSFRDGAIAWLTTYYVEAVERRTATLPSLQEFIPHRRNSVGETAFLDMCELVHDADLPDEVRRLPSFVALRNAACDHMGLINDIHSVDKDLKAGYRHNAVFVARQQQDCDLTTAVELVNDLVTGAVLRMIAATDDLPGELAAAGIGSKLGADAMTCAQAYRDLVRGDYDFHFLVDRYTAPEQVEIGAPDYVANLFAKV